jgi:hypothetical protein
LVPGGDESDMDVPGAGRHAQRACDVCHPLPYGGAAVLGVQRVRRSVAFLGSGRGGLRLEWWVRSPFHAFHDRGKARYEVGPLGPLIQWTKGRGAMSMPTPGSSMPLVRSCTVHLGNDAAPAFPRETYRKIWSNNLQERLNKTIRRSG